MKISFRNHVSDALLTRKQGRSFIISSLVIGFFIGVSGSYLLQNNFGLLVIAVLGIVAILLCLGGAGNTLFGWRKVDRARSTPAKKNVPRITSEWHYRPRKAIRVHPAVDCASAETSDVLNPELLALNDAWSKGAFYEWTDPTFINSSHDIRGSHDESAPANPDIICTA